MTAAHEVLFDVPGPRARARQRVLAAGLTLALGAALAFALVRLYEKGNLAAAKWSPFLDGVVWTEYLLPGLRGTLLAAAISVVLAGVFGLVFGLGRLSGVAAVRIASSAVVEFFRAVPVLVMMIFSFAMYTQSGLVPPEHLALAGVVTGLTLYNGSIIAELIRSGVHNLPGGQREAGLSIGLTRGQTLRTIELPQALTAMLPSLLAQLVVILKDTAIGYVITYPELLRMGSDQLGTAYATVIPAFIVVAALYIAVNTTITTLAGALEARLRRRGHTAGDVEIDATDQAA